MTQAPNWIIRSCQPADAAVIRDIIHEVMTDIGAVGPGFAIVDPEVDDMPAAYAGPDAAYFVVERKPAPAGARGVVLGGAGIGPLADADPSICELRKMYFLDALRGQGAGRALLAHCLDAARERGYRQCYLETLPHLDAACHLYEQAGFQRIPAAMGNTGHFGCNRFYLIDL